MKKSGISVRLLHFIFHHLELLFCLCSILLCSGGPVVVGAIDGLQGNLNELAIISPVQCESSYFV